MSPSLKWPHRGMATSEQGFEVPLGMDQVRRKGMRQGAVFAKLDNYLCSGKGRRSEGPHLVPQNPRVLVDVS